MSGFAGRRRPFDAPGARAYAAKAAFQSALSG